MIKTSSTSGKLKFRFADFVSMSRVMRQAPASLLIMPLFQRVVRIKFYPKIFAPEARSGARQPLAVQVRL